MAGLIKVLRFTTQIHQTLHVRQSVLEIPLKLCGNPAFVILSREGSFYTSLNADQLWKSVTSVSNAGRKRGRARGLMRRRNLNKGQVLGVGKVNMVWPGLNAPILKGKEMVQRVQLPPDEQREANLIKIRDTMSNRPSFNLDPLDRGWSGNKLPGRSIGPPDPIGGETFENFDTRVLEHKAVANMSATFGRVRRISAFCVTGNGNGLAGFALAKSPETKTAIRNAKNKAGQRLQFINLCDNHTVFHNFYVRFGCTKIFVQRKPKGHGLICHRAIKTICEAIGIKDLHAKVEGAINVQNITKGFFMGLQQQKTHSDIANEKQLNLVEIREETGGFPRVVGKPTQCRTEVSKDEVLDYQEYMSKGQVKLKKRKFPPWYTKLESWQYHLKKSQLFRNHEEVRIRLMAEHGTITSFLNKKMANVKDSE